MGLNNVTTSIFPSGSRDNDRSVRHIEYASGECKGEFVQIFHCEKANVKDAAFGDRVTAYITTSKFFRII